METPGLTYKTLRDEIAIATLQGTFVGNPDFWWADVPWSLEICQKAYQWADSMLKARESNSTA
jgi:hypothetical protein